MGKRKNVRNMKKVLRAHGSPVPKDGCVVIVLIAAGSVIATGATILELGGVW